MRISDWSSDVCSSDLSSPPPAADGAIISAPPQHSSCSPAGDYTTITCVSHTALLKRAPGLSVLAIVCISLPFSECADFKSDAGRETRPLAGQIGRETRREIGFHNVYSTGVDATLKQTHNQQTG